MEKLIPEGKFSDEAGRIEQLQELSRIATQGEFIGMTVAIPKNSPSPDNSTLEAVRKSMVGKSIGAFATACLKQNQFNVATQLCLDQMKSVVTINQNNSVGYMVQMRDAIVNIHQSALGSNDSIRNALTTHNSEIELLGSRLEVVKSAASQLYGERQVRMKNESEMCERMKLYETSVNSMGTFCKAGIEKALSQEGERHTITEKTFGHMKESLTVLDGKISKDADLVNALTATVKSYGENLESTAKECDKVASLSNSIKLEFTSNLEKPQKLLEKKIESCEEKGHSQGLEKRIKLLEELTSTQDLEIKKLKKDINALHDVTHTQDGKVSGLLKTVKDTDTTLRNHTHIFDEVKSSLEKLDSAIGQHQNTISELSEANEKHQKESLNSLQELELRLDKCKHTQSMHKENENTLSFQAFKELKNTLRAEIAMSNDLIHKLSTKLLKCQEDSEISSGKIEHLMDSKFDDPKLQLNQLKEKFTDDLLSIKKQIKNISNETKAPSITSQIKNIKVKKVAKTKEPSVIGQLRNLIDSLNQNKHSNKNTINTKTKQKRNKPYSNIKRKKNTKSVPYPQRTFPSINWSSVLTQKWNKDIRLKAFDNGHEVVATTLLQMYLVTGEIISAIMKMRRCPVNRITIKAFIQDKPVVRVFDYDFTYRKFFLERSTLKRKKSFYSERKDIVSIPIKIGAL